jgi:hypothetical protein
MNEDSSSRQVWHRLEQAIGRFRPIAGLFESLDAPGRFSQQARQLPGIHALQAVSLHRYSSNSPSDTRRSGICPEIESQWYQAKRISVLANGRRVAYVAAVYSGQSRMNGGD